MPLDVALENKTLVRQLVEELANQHRPEAWQKYSAPHFKHHFAFAGISDDLMGIQQISQRLLEAFPDVHTEVQLLIAEGDWVVERAIATATHLGPLLDIAPTHQKVTWAATHCYRIQEGKIVAYFPQVRFERIIQQLRNPAFKAYQPKKTALVRIASQVIKGMQCILPALKVTQSTQEEINRAIVRTYIESFKNKQRYWVFPKLYATQQFRHHFNFEGLSNTLGTFVSVGMEFLTGFPDVQVEIIALIAEGEYVVELNRVQATHQGKYFGITATHRTVYWREAHIYRLANGRIVENWPLVNFESILQQITI
ncbi:MAG: ester cyclase family protein [Bacteroidota bacterium]